MSYIEDDIHRSLTESVRGWSRENLAPHAADRDANQFFDISLYTRLDTELGLMNITLPEELGGADMDVAGTVLAIESLSEYDPGIAMSYLAQELLFSHQLYWTWKSLGRPLPARHADILKKKRLSGMAMSEPNAGTDVLGMTTTATPNRDGFVINGVKQWITNGTVADYLLVYARTGEGRRDISLFVVDAHTPGLTRVECSSKMGMRSSDTGILTFQDCQIPPDSCVGELNEGLRPMIRNLSVERLGLAAESVGIARACIETMKCYVVQRHAFGHPIVDFGQIQKMLSESYASFIAMRAMLYDTLHQVIDNSPNASMNADATKLFCSGQAEKISRSAIQILGANGYTTDYPVERLHRDAILLSIGGGTDEALQKNISRLLTR